MSSQTKSGRALEYAIIKQLKIQLSSCGFEVKIIENEPFFTSQKYYFSLTEEERKTRNLGAVSGVKHIISIESHLSENTRGPVTLSLQSSHTGTYGDPRDLIICKEEQNWEIGISSKNNHTDLKHSRLSPKIDFGKAWLNSPVSRNYWDEVNPIFNQIKEISKSGLIKWEQWKLQSGSGNDLKNQTFVIPILKSFEAELKRLMEDPGLAAKLLEYLIGVHDFYQLINLPNEKSVKIVAFNLHGNLGQKNKIKGKRTIGITRKPEKLINTSISNTTLEAIFNDGWQLKFRLHTASSKIEPSLKFAIGLIGMPTSTYTHSDSW